MPTLDESLLHLLGSSGQVLTAEEAHQKVQAGFRGPTLADVQSALLRLRNKGLVDIVNPCTSFRARCREMLRVSNGERSQFPLRFKIAS